MKITRLRSKFYSASLILVIAFSFTFGASTRTFAQENQAQPALVSQIRRMEVDEAGIHGPMGLVFSARLNAFYVLDAKEWGAGTGSTELIELTPVENRSGSARIAAAIQDPINMAYDEKFNRLLILQTNGNQLLEVRTDANGKLDPATLTRYNVRHFDIQNPQGLSVDSVSGDLFILDAKGPGLVRVTPSEDGNFENSAVSVVDLQATGVGTPRGIALDPSTGNLHVLSTDQNKLYELTQTGQVAASRDLSEFSVKDSRGMVFAPSGDQTDDPSRMNLYLADKGSTDPGTIIELSFAQAAALPPGTSLLPASLVQIIDTSNNSWDPSAPDPAGVDFHPASNRLIISDSEVDEMTYFKGKNVFGASTSGALLSTCFTSFTNEPTGVAVNPNNNHIFFTTDSNDRVFEVDLGPDGNYCTVDDVVTTVNVITLYNISDAEDVAYGSNSVFIAGGIDAEVYRIPLGGNGVLGGGDDGPVTHFDTASLGFNDMEGLGFNAVNGTLFLVSPPAAERYLGETSLSGTLLRAYDLSLMGRVGNIRSDVAYAPSSQNAQEKSIYIASRGVDNDSDPQENDGRVWEIDISGSGTPPTATPPPTGTPPPPPSGDPIFADGFESGNFSAWSLNKTDSGDLSVTSAAAMQGSKGMQANIDDNVSILVTDDTPASEPRYRARFYFDPNSINMTSGDKHYIFNSFMGTGTPVMRVEFRRFSGGYQLRIRLVNDSGNWVNSIWFGLTDAQHAIEVDWRASSGAGANDGGMTLWIDGTQQVNMTGVDNDTRRVDRVRLGAVAGIDSGTRGIYYFDAFESRRQSYIGP